MKAAKMPVDKIAATAKDDNKAEADKLSQFEEEDWTGDTWMNAQWKKE